MLKIKWLTFGKCLSFQKAVFYLEKIYRLIFIFATILMYNEVHPFSVYNLRSFDKYIPMELPLSSARQRLFPLPLKLPYIPSQPTSAHPFPGLATLLSAFFQNSYKWNVTGNGISSCLASFTQQDDFQIHLQCCLARTSFFFMAE